MATEKVIGKIEVASIGDVKIVGVNGVVRDATYEGLMYEGEQLVSNNPETLFQIRYLALPGATVYEGVFGVLADGSVIANVSELETLFGDDIDFMETAAGSGEPDPNSGIPEDAGIFAASSVQGFNRGGNPEVTGLNGVGTKGAESLNSRPVVEDVVMSVLETADEDYDHDTGDDVTTTLTGTLVATDYNPNDTHVFHTQNVNVTSLDIDPSEISISSVVLTNNAHGDGTPNSAVFTIEGNFNALAAGETATVTFQYYAVDDSMYNVAPNESEPRTVTITVTGTNDQPVVTDVNANEISFWNLISQGASEATIEELAQMDVENPGSNPTDGSAIKFTITTQAGEYVEFNWDFISDDYMPFNDFSFVIIDGTLTTLEAINTGDGGVGSALLPHTFTTAGEHTIVFGVMNSGDTALDSVLNIEHISGGTVVDITYVGNVSENVISDAITIYETTSEEDSPLVDLDDSDVYTTFEGLLSSVQDDDINDTHTYHMVEGSATVTSTILLGHEDGDSFSLNDWGEADGAGTRVFELENGLTITTTSNSGALQQYDHNAGHVGEGIGDNDGAGINNGETITVTFAGGFVTSATFGFDGLGGHFVPEPGVNAQATWIAYNNGIEVASGEVQRDGDNFVEVNADVPFDMVVFGTDSTAGSNWELKYVEADIIYEMDPSFITVNEDGTYGVSGDFNYLNVGETAEVTFQYYVVDDSEFQDPGESNTSEPKTVTLTITGTNDVPVAVADSGTTSENVTVTMDIVANDTDIDNGAVLSLDAVSVGEDLGSVSIVANQLFFDPGTDFDYLAVGESSTVVVSYTMSDEHGAESSSTATITVTGTNDAPVISESDVLFVSEAAGYNNVLVAYILDGDGNPINPVIAVMDTNSGHATGSLMSSLDMPAGDIHFAIIANGQSAYPGIADATLTFDSSGAFPQLLINGSVSTAPVYFDQNSFNPDGKDHFDSVDNGDGTVTINMEDLNLGDNDRQDLVITLVDNTVGDVKELVDGHDFENTAMLTTTGALSFDDLDLSDTHTASATPNEAGYLGTLTVDINPAATGPDAGQINWDYSVNDADVNHLAEGETLTQVYTITVDDGNGGTDTQEITITIEGTNDAPIAYDDTVTKVADIAEATIDPNGVYDGMGGNYHVVQDADGDYGINQTGWGSWFDSSSEIDSLGENEQIIFTFGRPVDSVDVTYTNFDWDDNASYQLFMDGSAVTGRIHHEPNGTLSIDNGVMFNSIVIHAEEADGLIPHWPFHWTDFQVANVVASYEYDTVAPFVIDDATLLANDIDEDGDVLSISGVDGTLYLAGTTIPAGTISIDANGDILVTPNAGEEFTNPVTEYATFEYTIDDGNGGVDTATATINIRTGSLVEGVEYADVDNALVVEGTIDLSDVSNINVIQLDNDNTLAIESIDAEDVLGATGADNTLIINSLDGGATDQVTVHETMIQGADVSINGTDYASYSGDFGGDMATLLIEIEPPVDVVY